MKHFRNVSAAFLATSLLVLPRFAYAQEGGPSGSGAGSSTGMMPSTPPGAAAPAPIDAASAALSQSPTPLAANDETPSGPPTSAPVGESQAASLGLPAPSTNRFGSKHTLAISTDLGFTIRYTHISSTPSGNNFQIQIAPGFDYFLLDNFSLGVFVGLDYLHTSGGGISTHSTLFDIGGRAGYNFWLMDRVSVWPRLGLSYTHNSAPGGVSSGSLALNISAPFLYHAENLFIGWGPALDVDLTGNSKATTIAGVLTLGGWL
jgi:hypothetical protein